MAGGVRASVTRGHEATSGDDAYGAMHTGGSAWSVRAALWGHAGRGLLFLGMTFDFFG